MGFWPAVVVDLLWLLALLGLASAVRRRSGLLDAAGVPTSMLAGLLALGLGPSGLGVLAFDPTTYELVVYHGLALVFLCMTLVPPPPGHPPREARSVALAIPAIAVLQAVLGLAFVVAWGGLHPGFGEMLGLGFSQGPGQALSLGRAFEARGMAGGGQIGLAFAALGFVWSCLLGVPLVHLGRRRGWLIPPETWPQPEAEVDVGGIAGPGELDRLARQLAIVGALYLATWGVLTGLAGALGGAGDAVAMLWGFHFLVAALLGVALRRATHRALPGLLDGAMLRHLAGTVVDVSTAAAFAAVQVALIAEVVVPMLALGALGAVGTAWVCLWLARRAFPTDPFGHALALYGQSTGTLPTGLALLRVADPELRSPAARNLVLGAASAIVPGAPVLLVLLPLGVSGPPDAPLAAVPATLAAMAVYLVGLGALWAWLGPLTLRRPLRAVWPSDG